MERAGQQVRHGDVILQHLQLKVPGCSQENNMHLFEVQLSNSLYCGCACHCVSFTDTLHGDLFSVANNAIVDYYSTRVVANTELSIILYQSIVTSIKWTCRASQCVLLCVSDQRLKS